MESGGLNGEVVGGGGTINRNPEPTLVGMWGGLRIPGRREVSLVLDM